MAKKMLFGIVIFIFSVLQLQAAELSRNDYSKGYFQIGTDFNFGFNGGPVQGVFAVDTAENYGVNWRGLRIPLETAQTYEERIEPFFKLSFRAGFKDFHFLLEAPLRKDLEAWYNSDLKTNLTYKPSELDINVPINAYAKWNNDVGYIQFGRFAPDDLKISKNDILMGGLPYHDGILWHFTPGIFRYDFMLSSLNAWLFGDTHTGSTCPPEGTEAFAQKCTPLNKQVSNQRNRFYDENIKNLVFHRFGIETNKFWVYVVEQSMVGGKSLEFRSMNPFMFWHDNYATGYTSAMTSFELGYKTFSHGKFYAQINMEDISSPVGENKDLGTSRSVINYLVGFRQEIPTLKYGLFTFQIDAVKTDPIANNSRLPLLKYTGRRLYRSNYRDQLDKDYADAYFVDYPIGYRRGPDALDLWFDFSWAYKMHQLSFTFAWLTQGDKELYTDYDNALTKETTPSGVEEVQYLLDVLYCVQIKNWFEIYAGAGGRIYQNLSNLTHEDGVEGWIRSGIKFNFNPLDMKF